MKKKKKESKKEKERQREAEAVTVTYSPIIKARKLGYETEISKWPCFHWIIKFSSGLVVKVLSAEMLPVAVLKVLALLGAVP